MLKCSFFLFIAVLSTAYTCTNADCPNIINRAQWGGQRPKGLAYLILPLSYVIIHHTVTQECRTLESCSQNIRNIQTYHMDTLGWNDLGFSFFIGGDGNIYEGVGWNKEGAHTYSWNKKSIGIAFIGNYQNTNPNHKMLDAARKLIDCGKSEGHLRNSVKVLGGRQLTATLSPGDKLYSKIKQWSDWASTP